MKPDVEYTDPNGYTYRTNNNGNIEHVSADLKLGNGKRNAYAQRTVGGEARIRGYDDGGHLIGSQFNGSGNIDNLVPQSKDVNRAGGEWYQMESEWASYMNDENVSSVQVDISVNYDGNSQRPTSFDVKYWVNGDLINDKNIINSVE